MFLNIIGERASSCRRSQADQHQRNAGRAGLAFSPRIACFSGARSRIVVSAAKGIQRRLS